MDKREEEEAVKNKGNVLTKRQHDTDTNKQQNKQAKNKTKNINQNNNINNNNKSII